MRGVLFDLYGTLLVYGDMKKAWADWLHHFYVSLCNLGLTLSEEEFSKECERLFWKAEPALSATGLMPDEVAYIGDSEVDVEAAIAAGMMPVLIRRQDTDICGTRGSYETISDLREILLLFEINEPDL